MRNYLEEKLVWRRSSDPHYPYDAKFDGERCVLRVNTLRKITFTVLPVDDPEVGTWPLEWKRLMGVQI